MKNVTPMKVTAKDFVLQQPDALSAAEVVDKARAAGLEIKLGYVHSLRSLARKERTEQSLDDKEAQLIDLMLTVGLIRTEELFERARSVRNTLGA